MKVAYFFFWASLLLPISIVSQGKLTLTPDMLTNLSTKGDAGLLIDEQHLITTPIPQVVGSFIPTTTFFGGKNSMYYPLQVVIDLGVNHQLTDLYLFDTNNKDSLKIYVGTPGNWHLQHTAYLGSYQSWKQAPLNTTSRFVMLEFPSTKANIAEIALFGTSLSSKSPLPASTPHKLPLMEDLIGMNAMHNQPLDKLKCVGAIREYHSWQWDEGNNNTSYPGYPNNQFGFNPSWVGGSSWSWNFDKTYKKFADAGFDLSPCLQKSVPYMQTSTSNIEHKPISPNDDPMDPVSYQEHARYLYQFVARYGSTKVPASKLMLRPNNQAKSGLGFIKYVENWNEEDKWWRGRDGYFSPYEMAAMCSADYDGHEGVLGSGYGAKNADPNIKFAMGGLTILGLEYIKSMKLWSDFNRSSGFPADVLNFHHYSNISGGQDGSLKSAISPEDDNLKIKLREIVEYRNQYLPGKEIWLSEFGYDTNPYSPQGVQAIGNNDVYEVQAQWLIRSYLEMAAAGIDRAHMYFFADLNSQNPNKFNSCGLVTEKWFDYQPKTSWYYVYATKNALTGYHFDSEVNSGNPDVNVYKFVNDYTSTTIYAAWCKTSTDKTISQFPISVGNALGATLLELQNGDTTALETNLSITTNGTISVNLSERPIFIRTVNSESKNCLNAVSKNQLTVYLDNNGQAQISAMDIDDGSSSNCGSISMNTSQTSFSCTNQSSGGYIELNSDSTWLLSTIKDGSSCMTFPWTGVNGNLPADSTFTRTATIGQPKSHKSIDSVPGSHVIKCENKVTFYRKQFTLNNIGSRQFFVEMTVDDDMEVYINGHLILREESHETSSAILPSHKFASDSNVFSSKIVHETFDYIAQNPQSFLHAGDNQVTLAIRNRNRTDNGGFSFRMGIGNPNAGGTEVALIVTDNITGAADTAYTNIEILDLAPPTFTLKASPNVYMDNNGIAPINITDLAHSVSDNCNLKSVTIKPSNLKFSSLSDSSIIEIVSDENWVKSTETSYHNAFSFPWLGCTSLPDSTTFSIPVTTGQPFNYNGIYKVPGTKVIPTGSHVTFFKKTFSLNVDSVENCWIELAVDDDIEIYINGQLIAREGSFSRSNSFPPAHSIYSDKSTTINGYNSGEAFDYTSGAANIANSLNTHGDNEIILAVRNGGNQNVGGFSFKLSIPISAKYHYPVEIIATDKSGNISSAYTAVELIDTIAPTIVASSPLLVPDSSGMMNLFVTMFDNGSYDNTSIESLAISPSSASCLNAQNATITAIDHFGNTSTLTVPLSVNTSLCPSGGQKSSSASRSNNEEEDKSWRVIAYPLPADDQLTVQLENISRGENISIQVWDLSGKLLILENSKLYSSSSTKQLDISDLASGQYFLKVKHSQGNKTMKFTVN